jgi:hypothetical protein
MTTAYVGHQTAREELERGLPPVALLTGPESVGKWTLARYLAGFHGIRKANILWLERLTDASAGELRQWAHTFGLDGQLKLIVVRLDGHKYDNAQRSASPEALNALLKVLEEPPPTVRFILVASLPPLATIRSRSRVYALGLLSGAEVEQILLAQGVAPAKAQLATTVSGGRVRPALAAAQGVEAARSKVEAALRAVAAGTSLAPMFREWGEPEHALLVVWATETAARRYRVFGPQSVAALEGPHGRFLLRLLGRYDPARSRLADRAALEQLARWHRDR